MSTVLYVRDTDPAWPATRQHPDAQRYHVLCADSQGVEKVRCVDAIGGEPTRGEVEAVLTPPA